MLSLLKLDLPAEHVTRLRSIANFDGLPLDARTVTDKLVLQENLMATIVASAPAPRRIVWDSRYWNYRGGKTTLCAGWRTQCHIRAHSRRHV